MDNVFLNTLPSSISLMFVASNAEHLSMKTNDQYVVKGIITAVTHVAYCVVLLGLSLFFRNLYLFCKALQKKLQEVEVILKHQ